MQPNELNPLVTHYEQGRILDRIKEGLRVLGKAQTMVTAEDLSPVDEFHIGGRQATGEFLDQLRLGANDHVLDIGCGIGGAARFAASRYGSTVTGVDLTGEYIETGNILCSWVGLSNQVTLLHESAMDMPFEDDSFDAAYMLHVGMNIEHKTALVKEINRVLKPGGYLGIFDVMRVGDGDLDFPLPWSSMPETSAVATPDEYKKALATAGFKLITERNRRDFAMTFFADLQVRMAGSKGPPPLGLHILMGKKTSEKISNVVAQLSKSRIAPIELIVEKPL
jgi:ubiquinone/menaquinone biosynthesis C-methylase UbiE